MEQVVWPGWKTVRVIGSGSYGKVYEIERQVFGRTEKAALKVITLPRDPSDIEELYNEGYDDESITQRFQSYLEDIVAEYSLMAEMKGHTNVVYCDDLHYIQHEDGLGWDIYIKMELLTPLMKTLQKNIPDQIAINVGKDICRALTLCKSRNIVHRDIKPQNIFVSKDGDYKLGDFGIAKTAEKTMGGTKIGTYKYMAPEVYNNQPYGMAADLYSLGMVLYWLLNERRTPFLPLPPKVPTASEEENSRYRRFRGEPLPPPAHGSEQLKQIVLKACAFSPSDRYPSAEEMLRALETAKPMDHAQTECVATSTMAKGFGITEQNTGFAHLNRENHADERTISIFTARAEAERPAEATVAAAQHAAGEPPFAEEETVSAAAREKTEMIVPQLSDNTAEETQAGENTNDDATVEGAVRSTDTVFSGSGVQPKQEGRLAGKDVDAAVSSMMGSDAAVEAGLQAPCDVEETDWMLFEATVDIISQVQCQRIPIVEGNMGEAEQMTNAERQGKTHPIKETMSATNSEMASEGSGSEAEQPYWCDPADVKDAPIEEMLLETDMLPASKWCVRLISYSMAIARIMASLFFVFLQLFPEQNNNMEANALYSDDLYIISSDQNLQAVKIGSWVIDSGSVHVTNYTNTPRSIDIESDLISYGTGIYDNTFMVSVDHKGFVQQLWNINDEIAYVGQVCPYRWREYLITMDEQN